MTGDGPSPMATDSLNDVAVAAGDPQDMAAAIAGLGRQFEEGWAAAWPQAAAAELPVQGAAAYTAAVICGMGGSAIGGDIAVACLPDLAVPLAVVRGYEPPAWVGPRTLLLGVSHSGGTEETLACVRTAARRGCVPVCVTMGGELAATTARHGWPLLRVPGGLMPRAALGFLTTAVLAVLERAGLAEGAEAQVAETAELLCVMAEELGPQVPEERNRAKQLARAFAGRLPFVYGMGPTTPAARRWKCQLNENAKHPCAWAELPEADHNDVAVWDGRQALLDELAIVVLADADRRLSRRLQATVDLLASRCGHVTVIPSRGRSPLARCCSALYVGDWTSLYLSVLNGTNPTPIPAIDALKAARSPAVLAAPTSDGG